MAISKKSGEIEEIVDKIFELRKDMDPIEQMGWYKRYWKSD